MARISREELGLPSRAEENEGAKALPKPQVEAVAKGAKRERTLGQKFKDTFIMEETGSIASYILQDVIGPSIKDMLFTVVTGSLSMALFGTVKGVGRSNGLGGKVTQYDRMYDRAWADRNRRAAKAQHRFEDLAFDDKYEADTVLEAMRDMVDEYGQCSVADMYELAGVSSDPIDRKWGWTNLRTASVMYSRGQYVIDLPKTKPVEV